VTRGKGVRATVGDAKVPCTLDRVNRQLRAQRPNQLWVIDFTYVSIWQGRLYVAFVIHVFATRSDWPRPASSRPWAVQSRGDSPQSGFCRRDLQL
jgi:hypothetical protein